MPRAPMIFIAALALVLSAIATPAVVAQDATPAGGEIVPASECTVEPRTVEEIEQLAATPAAGTGAEASPSAGQPADEATTQAVTDTYRQLVACLNAGDYLRVYALYTDDYIRRALGRGQIDLSQIKATPSPENAGDTALVSVRDVRTIDGGRVAARVETSDPDAGGVVVIDAILVKEGDRYLIDDETVTEAPTGATPAATPAGGTVGGGTTQATTVEVGSYDIYFEPDELTIPANTDVTVTLPNHGAAMHNFSIDELDISVDIAPGATEQTVINAPAGEYEYYCNVPGHKQAGMHGTLTVE